MYRKMDYGKWEAHENEKKKKKENKNQTDFPKPGVSTYFGGQQFSTEAACLVPVGSRPGPRPWRPEEPVSTTVCELFLYEPSTGGRGEGLPQSRRTRWSMMSGFSVCVCE